MNEQRPIARVPGGMRRRSCASFRAAYAQPLRSALSAPSAYMEPAVFTILVAMVSSIDLSGPYRKAAWAEKRRIALKSEIDAALFPDDGSEPLQLGGEFDEVGRSVLLSIERAPELPWYTGMMIGDVLHSLRSALDHTAWALVKAGSEPNPKAERLVQFPIYDDPADFRRTLPSRLPGISDEQRAIIESVQPYSEGEYSAAFATLAQMSNDDKHRFIHTSVVGTAAFNFTWEGIDCDVERGEMLFDIPDVPDLIVGTPLFRVHVTNVRSSAPTVKVVGDITPYVAIETRTSLNQRLGLLRDAVLHVMTRLDPDVANLVGREPPPETAETTDNTEP